MFSTPSGQPRLGEDLAPDQPADDRRPLGRLEHDRVAERERRGDRARGEDQRRVPRRDRADDADRPAGAPSRTRPACRRGCTCPIGAYGDRRRLPEAARARSAAGTSRSRSCSRSRARAARRPRPPRLSRIVGGLEEDRAAALRAASATTRGTPRPPPRSRAARPRRAPAATVATTSPRERVAVLEGLPSAASDPFAADELAAPGPAVVAITRSPSLVASGWNDTSRDCVRLVKTVSQ